MTTYDPADPNHRLDLAIQVLGRLSDAGFTRNKNLESGPVHLAEQVWSRNVNNSIQVVVYTSCSGHKGYISARARGNDAIRVATIYTSASGKSRGLAKQRRVYRTGKISDIGERLLERMRDAWRVGSSHKGCEKCGAPMFTSKKGNLVCAEVCWNR